MRLFLILAVQLLLCLLASAVRSQVVTDVRDWPGGWISMTRDGQFIYGSGAFAKPCDPRNPPPWRMRTDGTGFLAFDPGNTGPNNCMRLLGEHAASGDGSRVVYAEGLFSPSPINPCGFVRGPLWILDAQAGTFSQLASRSENPLISEDGSTVVYSGIAVNANGTNRRSLGLKPTGIDATGSKVVGYRWMGSHSDAFVVNGDGTGLLNLTNSPGFDESRTVISGDGTLVAVPRTVRPSGFTACFNWGWTDVVVMNSDGSGMRTLATLPGCPIGIPALTTTGGLLAINVTGHPNPNPMPGGMFLIDTLTGVVRARFPASLNGVRVDGSTLSADGTRLLGSVRNPQPPWFSLVVVDLALPDLKVLGPERIGATETVQVAAAPGSLFFLAASDTPGSLPIQPFGTLGLDPARISFLAQGVIGSSSTFRLPFPVPNAPGLVGFRLYLQALALEPTLVAGSFTNVVEVNLKQ